MNNGSDFDCFSQLNPALRDFYASREDGREDHVAKDPLMAAYDRPLQEKSSFMPSGRTYSFGEEKFKELMQEPLCDDFDDDFYPMECSHLTRHGDLYDAASGPIDEELVRQQLLLLSTRADEELMRDVYGKSSLGVKEPRVPEKKPISPPHTIEASMIAEHLQGFGEKRPDWDRTPNDDQNRKRRLCRHFLKGHCKRGKACDFLHDSSIFCPDLQKVFLGGLPAHITESLLRNKLSEQGYTVINKPKVLRGFTPQVCLGSVEEAQRLIEKGKINIDGSLVDVRPYEAFAKDNLEKKLPDDIKRSVFLGGLATGTTGQKIKDDLEIMDVKVVNHPIIKTGFSPMVTVGTVEQAQKLVKLKKVLVNDTLVDVRPYVDFRKRY